jgi:two-component system, NtrC family, nitrogen regulation response regulator NtrX
MPDLPSVVVVDDDPDICDVIRWFLEDNGFAVTSAASITIGRRRIAEERPGIAVIDVRMSDGLGMELAAFAAEAGCKVILMSGHPDEIVTAQERRQAFLRKPFQFTALLALINKLLNAEEPQAK